MQSYLFFLRLNIRTHLTLLRIFATELGKVQSEEVKPESLATLVTPSMQRILPVLRLYSSWLSRNVDVLSNNIDINLQPLQAEFWTCYAQVLTMINATFPPQYLPQSIAYMLSEDEDTIGLIALHCDENRAVWFKDAELRTKWHEVPTQHRNASTEMLARIRDLLAVGVGFAVNDVCSAPCRDACLLSELPACTCRARRNKCCICVQSASRTRCLTRYSDQRSSCF